MADANATYAVAVLPLTACADGAPYAPHLKLASLAVQLRRHYCLPKAVAHRLLPTPPTAACFHYSNPPVAVLPDAP